MFRIGSQSLSATTAVQYDMQNLSMFEGTDAIFRSMLGYPGSGIQVILVCGIWNPANGICGIQNPLMWNPESTDMESGIDSVEPGIHRRGIRNPQRGIRNPGLSWIALHRAIYLMT